MIIIIIMSMVGYSIVQLPMWPRSRRQCGFCSRRHAEGVSIIISVITIMIIIIMIIMIMFSIVISSIILLSLITTY